MTIYFSLGTNLGHKEQNLHRAVDRIEARVGKVLACSSFHATAPWGFASENTFLNAALAVETPLSPLEALDATQEIERDMGRTRKSVDGAYSDRVIDIDLLLCFAPDGALIRLNHPRLTLPHPLMKQRDFVMLPLAEVLAPAHAGMF